MARLVHRISKWIHLAQVTTWFLLNLLVEKAIVWSSTLAILIWHWQYREWDFPEFKWLRMKFGSPWIEKDAYRTSPIQLLSWYKFEGRSIVTECPWFWWLNQSWILLGGKQQLYEEDGWKSCKRENNVQLERAVIIFLKCWKYYFIMLCLVWWFMCFVQTSS